MKIKWIKKTCSACPAQWEGQLEDNRYFYARYRWGELSFRVSNKSIDDAVVNGKELFNGSIEDAHYLDGFMDTAQLLLVMGIEWK